MKKFYEMPVVEITEFNKECIMTASAVTVVDTKNDWSNQDALTAGVAAVNETLGNGGQAVAYSDSFGWGSN